MLSYSHLIITFLKPALVMYENTSDDISDSMWLHSSSLLEQGLESQVLHSLPHAILQMPGFQDHYVMGGRKQERQGRME